MNKGICPKCGSSCKVERGITGLKKFTSIEGEARDHIVIMAKNVSDLNRQLASESMKAIELLRRIAATDDVPEQIVAEITTLIGKGNSK